MLHLIPAPLHRAILPLAHGIRHQYRRIARPALSGVTVIVSDDEGRVLLVRHSYGKRVWALPGGGIGRGEEPGETARREMREELGCHAQALQLVAILEGRVSGAPHTANLFAARPAGAIEPDGREVIAAEFFALEHLPAELSGHALRCIAAWLRWQES